MINGLALKILSESGISGIRFVLGDQIAYLPTEEYVYGDEYGRIKSLGIGERRMEYRIIQDGEGQVRFMAFADGEQVLLNSRMMISEKEEEG